MPKGVSFFSTCYKTSCSFICRTFNLKSLKMATNWIYCMLLVVYITACVSETFVKYNDQTEVCCNGAVFKKFPGEQRCCGAVAYSPEEHMCCNQTLHPLPSITNTSSSNDSLYACCAKEGKVYNVRTHQCCSGLELEKPEVGAMYECCNGRLYTTRTHRCCNGSVVKPEPDFDCCGNGEMYDTLTKKCCKTAPKVVGDSIQVLYQIHDKDGIRKCCGLELYDASANYCCNQTVFPLPMGKSGQEDRAEDCCGHELKPNNLTNPLCHRDHWWGRNSTDYNVCGNRLFDFKAEICCGNQTLARDSGLNCCWSAQLPFDRKTQACCGSQVVALSKEDLERGTTSCCSPWKN